MSGHNTDSLCRVGIAPTGAAPFVGSPQGLNLSLPTVNLPGVSDSSAPPETIVSVNRARVQFGALVAVRDLSLHLKGGDLVGLIGPNGAGKTTLLRAMAGLQPLASGEVKIVGERVVPGAIKALRHIGFTPDNPAVYEELTVRRFLQFIGKAYHVHPDVLSEKIDFWLEQVWLKEKANQKIKALSRGMRQRIGIARTLLPDPTVVLLDEPAAGLDPAGRVQFRQLLCSLRDQGKALIVSSHILADMGEYCTHIGIMAKGALLQYGTVTEIANAGTADRCRYTMILARPVAGIADLLHQASSLVDGVSVDGETVTLTFPPDRRQAAQLLADLIRNDVPVASFSANELDLEEAYLRTGIRQVD